jgi:hypothetical protein
MLVIPLSVRTFRIIGLPVRTYLGSLWAATSSCVVMAAAVALVGSAFSDGPSYMSLLSKVLVGGVAYAASLLLLHRTRILVLRDLLQMLRTAPGRETSTERKMAGTEPELQPMGAV